ncbi:unnamed protein product [Rhodiola kirilowii]
MATRYQVRSVSLPSKSHPSIIKIHEELNRLRSLQNLSPSTSEIVCSSLAGLAELYTSVDSFLKMESTRAVLSNCKDALWVSELLDGSVQLLDVCSSLRNGMMDVKEHVQDVQSSLRRRNGDLSVEKSILNFACLRKKMKKDSKNMIALLNRMTRRLEAASVQESDNSLFSSKVQILIQVSVATGQVFESLLSFISTPVSTKRTTKWSLVSRMRRKKVAAAAWEDASINDFTSVDAALLSSHYDKDAQSSNDRLVSLKRSVEAIETHLERMFRHLVTSRVSLLNIFSQ